MAAGLAWLSFAATAQDPRDASLGRPIPAVAYTDMPLVVTLNDGSWLCVLTTGTGEEGATGQHITAVRSFDQGRTWSKPIAIEPPSPVAGGESSWAVPLHVPHQGDPSLGRVYVFYIFNGEPVRAVPNREPPLRLDMLGWFVMRFSDDGGKTWSERTRLPVPITQVDAANTFGGRAQMLWCVSKPLVHDGRVLLPFTKIGRHLIGRTEGWMLASENLLTEPDHAKQTWRLLPDGGDEPARAWRGIRSDTAFGDVQAEHHLVRLGDSATLAVFYRTDRGQIAWSRSHDGGLSWTEPEAVRYPDGTLLRHPRANVKVWHLGGDRLLLWFHNHGGTTFQDRNPAWLAGGLVRDGTVAWSQPEPVLFHPDRDRRLSYPDLIEAPGRRWLAFADKVSARISPLPNATVDGLFRQFSDLPPDLSSLEPGTVDAASPAVDLGETGGLTLEMLLGSSTGKPGDELAGATLPDGRGWSMARDEGGALVITLDDGHTKFRWVSEPGVLAGQGDRRVAVIADAAADLLLLVVDGRLLDGSGDPGGRQFGWARFPEELGALPAAPLRTDPRAVAAVRVEPVAVTVSEAVVRTRRASAVSPRRRCGPRRGTARRRAAASPSG